MNTALYFDGQTSQQHPCTVRVWETQLELELNEGGKKNILYYPIEDVSVQDFFSQKVLLNLNKTPRGPQLEWQGQEAEDFVKSRLQKKSTFRYWAYLVTHSKTSTVAFVGILLIVAAVALYYGVLAPFTGEKIADVFPIDMEVKAGEQISDRVLANSVQDSTKTVLLQTFFDKLNFPSEYDVVLTYLDESTMNAFAIPGGRIFVYDGLVRKTENWQELAAVLAHELAHVNERHSLKILARGLAGAALISALTGDMGGVSAILLENANQLNNLANSRRFEKEADLDGIGYMRDSDINPKYLDEFFGKLMEEEPDIMKGNRAMELLNSHPMTDERIRYIKEVIGADTLHGTYVYDSEMDNLWHRMKGHDGPIVPISSSQD